jgi:hypothetical protein
VSFRLQVRSAKRSLLRGELSTAISAKLFQLVNDSGDLAFHARIFEA